MPRKRARSEMEVEETVPMAPNIPVLLTQIRSMWEFAALMEYLFLFGKAVKLEDIGVEDFEAECLKPGHSDKLSQMGLALLKQVSSHKGLTPQIFDEYTRRQFVAKAPKRNPFGVDEDPLNFADFTVTTKIQVLHQLSVWTFNNPNTIREKLDQREAEQLTWRIEPYGWDKEERTYFLLDDNRLYRRTDAPPPPEEEPKGKAKAKAKAKSKKGGRFTRSNKRRRTSRTIPETSPEEEQDEPANGANVEKEEERLDAFCQIDWELVAVSMDDYQAFLDTIRKSRDPNEKQLANAIQTDVFPLLLEQEEERKRKEARRLRELENLQKLSTAKRSSRLAGKFEKIKEQEAEEEAERQLAAEREMAHREQAKQAQIEQNREQRRETREQRLKEREVKRILEEERLQQDEELMKKLENAGKDEDVERARISERKLKANMQRRKKELELLQQNDTWYFDCSVCGKHGQNLDDGEHSMACDQCNVWQHSACHEIRKDQAEREDFHFLCNDCVRKDNPVPPLKLRFSGVAGSLKIRAENTNTAAGAVQNGLSAPRSIKESSPSSHGHYSSALVTDVNSSTPSPSTHLSSQSLVYPGPPPAPPTASSMAPPGRHRYHPPHESYLPNAKSGPPSTEQSQQWSGPAHPAAMQMPPTNESLGTHLSHHPNTNGGPSHAAGTGSSAPLYVRAPDSLTPPSYYSPNGVGHSNGSVANGYAPLPNGFAPSYNPPSGDRQPSTSTPYSSAHPSYSSSPQMLGRPPAVAGGLPAAPYIPAPVNSGLTQVPHVLSMNAAPFVPSGMPQASQPHDPNRSPLLFPAVPSAAASAEMRRTEGLPQLPALSTLASTTESSKDASTYP